MTVRERNLVVVFLASFAVVGGGAMFYLFFWTPYSSACARRDKAQRNTATKADEKKREEDATARIRQLDPRLTRWESVSLPDIRSRSSEELDRHYSQESVEYEKILSKLFADNKVQSSETATKRPDARTLTPQAANKAPPAYQTFTYTVKATASHAAMVNFLKAFHQTEKLHQITEFKILKPTTASVPEANVAGGATPVPAAPDPRERSLEVSMTIEVLMVKGATTREERAKLAAEKARVEAEKVRVDAAARKVREAVKPPPDAVEDDPQEEQEEPAAKSVAPSRLIGILAPQRDYEDLLRRNIYTGTQPRKSAAPTLPPAVTNNDTPADAALHRVLKCVRLTRLDRENGRWSVKFTDQEKGGSYVKGGSFVVGPDRPLKTEFEVKDSNGNTVKEAAGHRCGRVWGCHQGRRTLLPRSTGRFPR